MNPDLGTKSDIPFLLEEPMVTTFLCFVDSPNPGKKTSIVLVQSKRNPGLLLGTIKWYGQWRQYVFYPEPNTLFNRTCLRDIDTVLMGLGIRQRRRIRTNQGGT